MATLDLSVLQPISWVAAAIGVCVAAIYYILNIKISQRNQELTLKALEQSAKVQELTLKAQQQNLETRQAQLLLGLSQSWTSGEFLDKYYQVNSWKINNFDDFEKMWSDPERGKVWFSMFTNWETMGVLVHEGLIDLRILARFIGSFYRREWERWSPYIKRHREIIKMSRSWIEAEYLYDRMMEFSKQNPDYYI